MVSAAGSNHSGAVPRVSVVIPTYRRPELLLRCLGGVLAQRLDGGFEVIVVDDGHDDATQRAVEALRSSLANRDSSNDITLTYLRPAHGRGPSVARNYGWRHARAPLVAFTDDDTVPQPGWLAHGDRAMRDAPQWSGLCGRVEVPLAPESRRRPTDHELMTCGLETAEFVTANAFVRRDALLRIGGFDEQFARAWREDSDLQFRLMREAGPVGRCPDAVVQHPVRRERWGVCLRQQKNAYFDALLYKKHPTLYRERIDPTPPWHYYGIVIASIGAVLALALRKPTLGAAALVLALALIARVAWRRLRPTSRVPADMLEMIATSALIPFLSVYWRLRGALRFRVLFL